MNNNLQNNNYVITKLIFLLLRKKDYLFLLKFRLPDYLTKNDSRILYIHLLSMSLQSFQCFEFSRLLRYSKRYQIVDFTLLFYVSSFYNKTVESILCYITCCAELRKRRWWILFYTYYCKEISVFLNSSRSLCRLDWLLVRLSVSLSVFLTSAKTIQSKFTKKIFCFQFFKRSLTNIGVTFLYLMKLTKYILGIYKHYIVEWKNH